MKLRILIADDHEVVRRGLCTLLQTREGWEVCGEAKDGREAVEKAKQVRPDVVILDVGMPNLNGLAATRQLIQQNPQQKVIVLTITDSDQVIREALDAGARGFVLKSDAARDPISAVEALQRSHMFLCSFSAGFFCSSKLSVRKTRANPVEAVVELPRVCSDMGQR